MIDAKDPGTVSMPLAVKRGRGRPRKADAMTPAQRAARYRARRVSVPFDRLGVSDDQFDDLVQERDMLREQLEIADDTLAWLRDKVAELEGLRLDESVSRYVEGFSAGQRDVTKKPISDDRLDLEKTLQLLGEFHVHWGQCLAKVPARTRNRDSLQRVWQDRGAQVGLKY